MLFRLRSWQKMTNVFWCVCIGVFHRHLGVPPRGPREGVASRREAMAPAPPALLFRGRGARALPAVRMTLMVCCPGPEASAEDSWEVGAAFLCVLGVPSVGPPGCCEARQLSEGGAAPGCHEQTAGWLSDWNERVFLDKTIYQRTASRGGAVTSRLERELKEDVGASNAMGGRCNDDSL